MRRARFGCVVLLCTFLVSGCWDRVEINDLAIVVAKAIDLEGDNEQEDQYRVTLQIPLPGQMGGSTGGGGGTSGNKTFYNDSDTGVTIREAEYKLQQRISRRVYLSHRRVLIIGEDLAKKGILPVFETSSRLPETRLTSYLIVAKGTGRDLLNQEPTMEQFSGEAMREIPGLLTDDNLDMKRIAIAMNQIGIDPIALYMAPKNTQGDEAHKLIELIGIAQFRDDQMVDVFEQDMAYGLVWLLESFIPYEVSMNEVNHLIHVRIEDGKHIITPIIRGGELEFDIHIHANAVILEHTQKHDLMEVGEFKDLESELNSMIQKQIEATIAQMQKHQTDSVGLGLYVHRKFPKLWQDKYAKDWRKYFSELTFNIQVEASISRVGLTTENIAEKENNK